MKQKKRWHVLVNLLKNKPHRIGAEIGVWKGYTTQYLLKHLRSIGQYYAIDPWTLNNDYKNSMNSESMKKQAENIEKVFNTYKRNVREFKERVITIRKTSEEASFLIEDESLDFVFIDGIHTYEYVSKDIKLWLPKLKDGGLLSGHDYEREDGNSTGVKKAVDEIFPKIEIGSNNVWWVWKNEKYINW